MRVTNRIGLVSTAVCDHPEIDGIVDDLAAMDYEVSVASLRLDDLTPDFVFKLADTGVQGLTLAPECGSDRMRRILNKQFTNDEILDKATWIFENGIQNLKLYYMVGLPCEEHADVEAIVDLTDADPRADAPGGRGRGRVGRIHPSVNPFVPEAGDAVPVAADGGPEGDRPQAAVPAQGLRRACRTWTPSARARARASRSRSSPSADRRVARCPRVRGRKDSTSSAR